MKVEAVDVVISRAAPVAVIVPEAKSRAIGKRQK
jgi:hypothetical protein